MPSVEKTLYYTLTLKWKFHLNLFQRYWWVKSVYIFLVHSVFLLQQTRSRPSAPPPPNKVRCSGLFKLIIWFRIKNIPTCRRLALTRHNVSGMIPLQHDTEDVRKPAHSATIVPVLFATILMFHTACGFLVHQQKRCNWCIIPFALDYRAVTRIRGKHRLSGASNLHFPACIRG